jgi:putative FmdB family regulatory protein
MCRYDYQCPRCNALTESEHGMHDAPAVICHCGTRMRKLISLVAFHTSAGAGNDWSNENGGRGRMINQLADKPGDPNAYARNPDEAYRKARAKFPEARIHRA